MGYTPLIEQDVRRSDVSVNYAAAMNVSKRATQLPGCAVEVSEGHLRTTGQQFLAVITESPTG